jgi:undecaprenyl-diphosphatase
MSHDTSEGAPLDEAAAALVHDPPADAGEPVLDLEEVVDPRSPHIRSQLAVGLTAAAAVGIVTIAVQARGGSLSGWDQSVHDWVLAHRGTADITLATVVTTGGITTLTLPALAVVGALALPGSRSLRSRLGAGALLAVVGSVGVYAGLLLNGATGRERPAVADWAGAAGGPSFPSGHTTAATIFALCCAWALSARFVSRGSRHLIWGAAVLWALAVGWSRVWLGVHWPSDVVGGWLFGTAWCAVAGALVAYVRHRSAERPSDVRTSAGSS